MNDNSFVRKFINCRKIPIDTMLLFGAVILTSLQARPEYKPSLQQQ